MLKRSYIGHYVVCLTVPLILLNVRFTILFPEVFAFLKRQQPVLGTKLSALINLLKEKHGYAISLCERKTKIHASSI